MFDCACEKTCSPSDPATATVKIDPALLAAASGQLIERWEASGGRFVEVYEEKAGGERLKFGGVNDTQQESTLAKEWEQEKKRREEERQREAERVATRAEEARLAREREEQEVLERERQVEREAFEEARRAREEAEAATAQKKAERERLEHEAQLAEEKARRLAIANFLKVNGFVSDDVNAPKKVSEACGLPFTSKTVYPIHVAAETGDATMLQLLIQEKADTAQKTSGGKTALELAQKKSKAGSHQAVLTMLGAEPASTSGGYASAK